MGISVTEAKIYRTMYDFFEAAGYFLQLEKKQFRKPTASGFVNVIFSVSEYAPDDALVEVHVGCRNQQVEQIAQQFLMTNLMDFRDDANTLIISIGKYNKINYFRYKIQSDDDVRDTCESVEDFLVHSGFAFLESTIKLADMDRILNNLPNKPCPYLYNQTHRCFKALIAAKLNDNPHYNGLIDLYRQYLEKFGNENDLLNFDKLVNYLAVYSAN